MDVKSSMKNRSTYGTTEFTEKASVYSKRSNEIVYGFCGQAAE